MSKISQEMIESYLNETFNGKSAKVYRSHLNKFAQVYNVIENESIDEILNRVKIGMSDSTFKVLKLTVSKFVTTNNDFFNQTDATVKNADNEPVTSDSVETQLRQAQELERIQAENLAKTRAEAKAKAEELERLKIAEAKAKAEAEAQRIAQARKDRLAKLTEGFEPEEIPQNIVTFDYMQNIPKTAKEYHAQGTEAQEFYSLALRNLHTILKGHAGSGKTELVIKFCKEYEIPLFKYSCSSDVKMADLIGAPTFDETGAIKFDAGVVTKGLLTSNAHGICVVLLDEINTLSEKVQKNINGLADGTGFIDLPKVGRLQKNKGTRFLIVGTMNAKYSGTNTLNPELKDRFNIVNMPKMSKDTRTKIFSKYNPAPELSNKIESVIAKLEKMQIENEIENDVVFSTRSQIAFLETLEQYESDKIPNAIFKAFETCLINKFDDSDDMEKVAKMVKGVIA